MGILSPSAELIAAARAAQKRLELRKDECLNEWATRLAPMFFADLEARQEPLGKEFSDAIYPHLDKLYED